MPTEMDDMHGSSIHQSGRCVCGEIDFRTRKDPQRITICHCLWCQRRTGTAFGTEVVYLQEDLAFSDTVIPAQYRHHSDESGRWLEVYFCPRCGTNLGFTLEAVPGIRTIPAGIFDRIDWLDDVPTRHVYNRTRRNWGEITDRVQVYQEHFRS